MKQWRTNFESNIIFPYTKHDNSKGMSLLHLAAHLGYSRLVSALILWRTENPNALLDIEIDAMSQDNDGYTPLVGFGLKIFFNLLGQDDFLWNYNLM